jgi:hypothetical protein
MRTRHEKAMRNPWHDAASVAFFETNAGFTRGWQKLRATVSSTYR